MKKRSHRKKLESLILLFAIMVHDERIDEDVRVEYANKYVDLIEGDDDLNGEENCN